jgi:hypothetical protein
VAVDQARPSSSRTSFSRLGATIGFVIAVAGLVLGYLQLASDRGWLPFAAAPAPFAKGEVTVVCDKPPASARRGAVIEITYHYTTTRAGTVGVGAGFYAGGAVDVSTRSGGSDALVLPVGTTSRTQSVELPANLRPGVYDLHAQLWPPGRVGEEGAETIAEATCGSIDVNG